MLFSIDQKIDDQVCRYVDKKKYTQGSGDNQQSTDFLEVVDEQGQHFWLLEDGSHYWLYQDLPDTGWEVVKEYESFQSDALNGSNSRTKLAWVGLRKGSGGEEISGLIVESAKGPKLMKGTALWKSETGFYRSCFPASQFAGAERPRLENLGVAVQWYPLSLGLLLGLFFGAVSIFGAWAGFVLPLFWLLGPLSAVGLYFLGPDHRWRPTIRFFTGLFFLHFGLHVLDANLPLPYVRGLKLSPEAMGLAVASIGLTGVYRFAPRLYAVICDGSIKAGSRMWALAFLAIGGYSFIDEYWHYSHFRYYLGEQPWGSLIFLMTIHSWWSFSKDYQKAPIGLKRFNKNLKLLSEGLNADKSGLAALTGIADDLEDMFSVSQDSRVLAFAASAPDFKRLRDELAVLATIDIEQLADCDAVHLRADLKTISDDLQKLRDAICSDAVDKFSEIRPSPFLETWKQVNE